MHHQHSHGQKAASPIVHVAVETVLALELNSKFQPQKSTVAFTVSPASFFPPGVLRPKENKKLARPDRRVHL
jgi:hypothetical protein